MATINFKDPVSDTFVKVEIPIPKNANDLPYNNETSQLSATNIQAAIDELLARIKALEEA